MGLQFNSNVDQPGPPNQASPGPNNTTAADAAIVVQRKGVVTRLDCTGNLTASRIYTFGSILSQGWLAGDIVFIGLPTHTGGGFTVTIQNIAGTTLCTWAALLANGGMFVFNGTDFLATLPGQSTT